MGNDVTITVDDRGAQAMLDRVLMVGKHPAAKAVADQLYMLVRDAYRSESDPWGRAWPPHSPLTLKARRKRGNASQQKLIDTDKLWASIKSSHTDTEAVVTAGQGLPDPRAVVNQFGTSNAGRSRNVRIPTRPFFPLRNETTADIPQRWWPTLVEPVQKALAEATA